MALALPPGRSGALPGTGGPGPQRRTRRHRTIFSEEQLQALEALFVQNQYPDVGTRERLAGRIRLREERVEVGGPAGLPEGPRRLAPFLLPKGRPWGRGGGGRRGGRPPAPQWGEGRVPLLGTGGDRHLWEDIAGTRGEVRLVFLSFVLNFSFL